MAERYTRNVQVRGSIPRLGCVGRLRLYFDMKKTNSIVILILLILIIVGVYIVLGYRQYVPLDEAEETNAEVMRNIEYERQEMLIEAAHLFKGFFYEEALTRLNENPSLINDETMALEAEIHEEINNLVLYEGPIRHVFLHSLVLYPEFFFPGESPAPSGYSDYFAFQSEFKAILPQLLERGYVLYSIHDIVRLNENGVMERLDIYLPPDRMPLVLSKDDPTLHYGIGFANRFIIDEDGELATEVITPEGETIITYDGDVQLVLDQFVRENPEFSFRGVKGIIAATGYMGIFGYDLQTEESRRDAIAIVERMKENGWLFANHSYSHSRSVFWSPNTQVSDIERDTQLWREIMMPIVGDTNIFIAPHGFLLRGAMRDAIINDGFNIYMMVDFSQPLIMNENHVIMGRIEFGGIAMMWFRDILNNSFFDVESVIHPQRPRSTTLD